MTDNNAVMHDSDEKRLILIVEDELINYELLKMVLKDDYEILYAADGSGALSAIRENAEDISLVLLDLNLPDMDGMEILGKINSSGFDASIPVIVLTADSDAEVKSLTLGASDFISKPYPMPEIIKARVKRTIELNEGRVIIGQTEHDSLTGLYTREYFYRYADQLDARHRAADMDAISVNINHFHMTNERYGRAYADEVLRRIGANISSVIDESDGIACRREADHFLIYCRHREDYADLLERISDGIAGEDKDESVVRLRMGIYPNADKTIDIEGRFDRAKLAADTVRSSFNKAVAIYDSELHESAIFAEHLLIDYPKALEEKQFKIFFQPKYNIKGDEPVICSAEALVRWQHPEFGLLNPGRFIELFEANGLIQSLDTYVWKESCAHIRDWKDRLKSSVPVSVNVSRVDMFDPHLVENILAILKDNGISNDDIMLEVTESAYTEDSEYIISMVQSLREAGFFIEMDDFGAGYSSLNMLTSLPIDALKLDMEFVRSAFKNGKDTRMLEIVIEIAASLGVPVIAEGVETEEQLQTLKSLGCDIVQGFYFSKPLPADEFEAFLPEK